MDLLERLLHFSVSELPYIIFSLIIAFTVHEFSHAYIANKLGDPTAKNEGRLTLNPMVHLDVLGTLMIFLAGFGWAKPVPVNYAYFKNKKLAGVLVSVAGPLSNLLVAALAVGLFLTLYRFGVFTKLSDSSFLIIRQFVDVLIYLNLILFIFNLLPIPPLDGYRVIEDLAPRHIRPRLVTWEKYGGFIFLLLVITPLGNYLFPPIFGTVEPYLFNMLKDGFSIILGLD